MPDTELSRKTEAGFVLEDPGEMEKREWLYLHPCMINILIKVGTPIQRFFELPAKT